MKPRPTAAAEDPRERILDATAELLRRFGHRRLRVTDVGAALGVSHAAIYRHFASRDELLAEVVRRWLGRVEQRMDVVCRREAPAAERLVDFAVELHRLKREKVSKDPELFDALHALAVENGAVVARHLEHLHRLLVQVLQEGHAAGEFAAPDPERAARVYKTALAGLHDPRVLRSGLPRDGLKLAAEIAELLVAGMRSELSAVSSQHSGRRHDASRH